MGEVIGQMLPAAVAIAISPFPIIAVILMLFTPRARTNGPAFLVGWIVGLVAVGVVVLLVAGGAGVATDEPSNAASAVQLVLGALLLFLAARSWRGRPKEGEEEALPKWMQAVDGFTPVTALGLGAFLAALNPKNLILAVAGATTLAQAGLDAADDVIVWAVFVAIATSTILALVLYYLVGGESAEGKLDELKAWLGRNNAIIMAVLLLVLGVKLVGDGISGLAA